ncbi:endoglin [Elgaria multicarinata webbii]|uniref:endoglin n=1 Tax=Elgaria multicarinata webbii TaxID=159646 RepID=UPI002FCCE109
METAQRLAVLLLASGAAMLGASPVNVPDCILEPVRKDQDIKIFYTTSKVASGCVSRGPPNTDLAVHVLNLRYSVSEFYNIQFNVSTAEAKGNQKMVFVVSSDANLFLDINTDDCSQPDCHLTFITNQATIRWSNRATNATVLPFSSEELLDWARATFGGVSSFTDLENPEWIHFQAGREPSSAENCVLEKDFNAEQYLEAEVISHNIERCLGSGGHPQKAAHIMWLQDSSIQTVDLNIKVTCSDQAPVNELPMLLILKSHGGLLWNMNQMPQLGGLLVSGRYRIQIVKYESSVSTALPDTKEGLIQAARNHSAFIASYTEIPSAKSITLELVRICGQKTVTTVKPQQQGNGMTEIIKSLIDKCQPWRCRDSSIEIALPKKELHILSNLVTEVTLQDPNCRATDNVTHFVLESVLETCFTRVEGGVFANNELVIHITQNSHPDVVTVPFKCDLPEKISLQLYHTPDFKSPSTTVEVNKVTYVQVSARTADRNAFLKMGDCFLETPDEVSQQRLVRSDIPWGYSVESKNSSSPTVQRFSFIYKAKEQWASSPATIVCQVSLNSQLHPRNSEASLEVTLTNGNASTPNQGLSIGSVLGITFGAFLIGVLLTAALWYIYSQTRPMAKMQPVSANLPASESSSTNHSIGSTQSTPCSTSSMA